MGARPAETGVVFADNLRGDEAANHCGADSLHGNNGADTMTVGDGTAVFEVR